MSCFEEEGTNIFSTGAGTIVSVDGTATTFAFTVDNNASLFDDLQGLVTSIGYSAQSGFQFMHALREFIYLYVFTERVGEIVLNGLVAPASCIIDGSQSVTIDGCQITAATGLERIIQWYECNRVTSRADPINIALGSTVSYDAFLVGMKADIVTAETGIAQFSLRFNYIPNISDNDEQCFPADEDCLEAPC